MNNVCLRTLGISLIGLLLILIGCDSHKTHIQNNAKSAKLPAITQIFCVEVGKSTMNDLEKRLGPGAPCIGGHPNGGRAWYLTRQRLYIYADAFDYNKRGDPIIDTFRMGFTPDSTGIDFTQQISKPPIPHVNISSKSIGWIGKILPGQSMQSVLNDVDNLPKPQKQGDTLIWTLKSEYRTVADTTKVTWTATLTFSRNKLLEIDIS